MVSEKTLPLRIVLDWDSSLLCVRSTPPHYGSTHGMSSNATPQPLLEGQPLDVPPPYVVP